MVKVLRFLLSILALAIFINVVSLDFWLLRFKSDSESKLNDISRSFVTLKEETETTLSYRAGFLSPEDKKTETSKITPTLQIRKEDNGCPASCQLQIDAISKAISKSVTPTLSTPSPTPQNNFVREVYIPLGGATTLKSTSYKTTGAMAYVDLGKYGQVKTVYFEVVLSIPTANGTVYARLINVTDSNTPVVGSEVSTFASTPGLLTSSPINLAYGNKLYAVQLRTTMDFEAVLEIARLRIQLQ